MSYNKPYLTRKIKLLNASEKHPTVEHDSVAYASGAQKSFTDQYNSYISSVETIDLAIRTIANIISLCKLETFTEDSNGKLVKTKVKNIDLDYPNEVDSRVDFNRKLAVSIFSQGAGLIVGETSSKGSINFYTLDTGRLEAISDGKRLISEFAYTAEDNQKIHYKAEDCIYINDSIDPSNLLYSLSRLKSLNDVILMQAGIVGQAKDMLNGGSKKAAIISAENPISSKNMKVIKDEFDTFMRSASSSSFFMNTKLDVQLIGNSMTGAELLSLLQEVNGMMLKHYSIPQFLYGESSKGANKTSEITYLLRTFFNGTLLPVLTNIELHFTRYFREKLNLKNIVVKYNYKDLDILKMPEEELVDLAIRKHKAGLCTLNEAREMIELEPIEGEAANKVFMPAYLLGNYPVSYDSYTSDLERYLNINSVSTSGSSDNTLPNGNSGGEDNTNHITDSRGGPQDA